MSCNDLIGQNQTLARSCQRCQNLKVSFLEVMSLWWVMSSCLHIHQLNQMESMASTLTYCSREKDQQLTKLWVTYLKEPRRQHATSDSWWNLKKNSSISEFSESFSDAMENRLKSVEQYQKEVITAASSTYASSPAKVSTRVRVSFLSLFAKFLIHMLLAIKI